ncbi:hypothetical protein QYF61_005048 [Mycteria americana]|uniref:Uncharacterized protein n=1 Tax=Mycteria americana TaxID=33587 RepID=A0AAN7NKI3_MYCAM|nr:hypothetical protein QYF61_005048 [Mycteria americana]
MILKVFSNLYDSVILHASRHPYKTSGLLSRTRSRKRGFPGHFPSSGVTAQPLEGASELRFCRDPGGARPHAVGTGKSHNKHTSLHLFTTPKASYPFTSLHAQLPSHPKSKISNNVLIPKTYILVGGDRRMDGCFATGRRKGRDDFLGRKISRERLGQRSREEESPQRESR